MLIQGETVNSFIKKLKAKAEARNVTAADSFLRQSRAAAGFDAVVAIALAYDELLQVDEFALERENISHVLNKSLSMLKLKGLAVNILE